MKSSISISAPGRTRWFCLAAAFITLVMAAATALGQSSCIATGRVTQVLAPTIACPNALGQMLYRATAFTTRFDSADPRLKGRRTMFTDGYRQNDGTFALYGTAYHEVGIWTGTNFTPNGTMWELRLRGVMQPDYSLLVNLAGCGMGGNIEGLRLEETATRPYCADPLDATVPIICTGTIKSPPVDTTRIVDNFNNNLITGWYYSGSGNFLPLLETNQQFTVRGHWPGVRTFNVGDSYAFGILATNWSVANNQTLECRVDLVRMSEDATNSAGIALSSLSINGQIYYLGKHRDAIGLSKQGSGGYAVFFHERRAIKNTNVVLSLSLTRLNPNVVLTARVLDKANQDAVLYQRSVVDTPQADPTLTRAQLLAVSGMDINIGTDYLMPPSTYGDKIAVTIWQYTDGRQPPLTVTFDNLQMRTSEVPLLGIEPAVRVSWLGVGALNYAIEAGPSIRGPWQPVPDATIPGMNHITAPATDQMRFFRAVQSP